MNSLNKFVSSFFAIFFITTTALVHMRDDPPRVVMNLAIAQAVTTWGGQTAPAWGLDRTGRATLWSWTKINAPAIVAAATQKAPSPLKTARLILLCVPFSVGLVTLGMLAGAHTKRSERETTRRGPRLEDLTTLRQQSQIWLRTWLRKYLGIKPGSRLTLGQIALHTEDEVRHILCIGSTGSGKSTAIYRLLHDIRRLQPHAKLVVLDLGGSLKKRCMRPGDLVLNPFDSSSVRWSIFAEIDPTSVARSCNRLAAGLLLAGSFTKQGREWAEYTLRVLAALLERLHDRGAGAADFATSADPDRLTLLLEGRPEAAILKTSSSGSSGSIQFMLASSIQKIAGILSSFESCSGAAFSVRDWTQYGRGGTLWITYSESARAELQAFHSTIISEIAKATMGLSENPNRRIYIFADELGSLGKVDGLEDLLTKGRKFGVGVVACLQSLGQLEEHYGPIATKNLIDNFNSLLILRTPGYQSAKYFADVISEVEVDRTEVTYSRNKEGRSSSESVRRERKQLVMPGEIMNLPKLHGFVKIGSRPGVVYKTTVPIANSDLG